jgi:exopolyphosphatase / guanosine-5'-triphosphate,3'-diphosphate pyrophosphatase
MRLGVLDVGSNSAHLRVVDAYPGSPPLPVFRQWTRSASPRRSAPTAIGDGGVRRLVEAVRTAVDSACRHQVAELIPFATFAVRDAANRDDVLHRLGTETGIAVGSCPARTKPG